MKSKKVVSSIPTKKVQQPVQKVKVAQVQVQQQTQVPQQQFQQQVQPLQNQIPQLQKRVVLKNPVKPVQYNDDEVSQFLLEKQSLSDSFQQKIQENQIEQNVQQGVQEQVKQQNLGSVQYSQTVFSEDQIQVSLQSLTKALKLSSKEEQVLPVQAQINTLGVAKNLESQKRPNIDLICVIDVSGSMHGEKLQLVKDTLIQLGDYLNENDRICLISFQSYAQRETKLLTYTKENKQILEKAIDTLHADGGTDIKSGMELAYKVIKERKFQNEVTSIFLLSDGQDGQGLIGVKQLEQQYKIQTSFTINCFGFGSDHDPVLMSGVAKVGDGNFYFVEKLDVVDELFVDALGGLFSVLAQNLKLTIKLREQGNSHFKNVTISKTYGNQWTFDKEQKSYSILIKQLIGGVTKEFLFDITVPPIQAQLSDHERNASFIECTVQAENLEGKLIFNKQTFLQLAIYNENEVIVPEINEEVEINVIRIQGAEVMNQIKEKADKGEFQVGQQIIDNFQTKISKLKPQQQKKLEMLSNDLGNFKVTCSNQQQYQQFGKIQIISSSKQHMEKRSKGAPQIEGMESYQNDMQKVMVLQQKSKKMKM